MFLDSKLVVNQMNDSYQTKHNRMRAYKNEVWNMLGIFFTKYKVRVIPKREYQVPIYSKKKYKIAVVNRPSIPDNSKY